jgi:hypothetical protein
MDKSASIRILAAHLDSATAARDWDRLATAVRALPAALRGAAAHGQLGATERHALEQLRSAHEAARAACADAARDAAAQLDEMQRNRLGWIAYALEAGHKGQP